MLTLESPFYEFDNVLVFRDHAVATQFYYLAGSPHLTRGEDGKPVFTLLKYRHALDATVTSPKVRDQLGGAFLMFAVDCGLADSVKADIQRELESRVGGEVSLVPVLYTRGTVNVIALDAQRAVAGEPGADPSHTQFVRGILGTATPSLLQEQQAIFSLSLTPDAATILEQAYDADLSPIGVLYELEFSGLRPAIAVKATVDKKKVYEQFKLGLHIGVGSGGGTGTGTGTGGQTGAGRTGTGTTTGAGTGATTGAHTSTGTAPAAGSGAGATTTGAHTTPAPGAGGVPGAGSGAGATTTGAHTTPAPGAGGVPGGVPGAGSATGASTSAGAGASSTTATSPPPAPLRPAPPAPGGQGGAGSGSGSGAGTGTGSTGSGTGSGSGAGSGSGGSAGGTQVAVDADISYAITKLQETDAIHIEIVRQAEGASVDDMQKWALDLLKDSILNEFFKPAMTPNAVPAVASGAQTGSPASSTSGQAGAGTRVAVGFQLQYKKDEELETATYDFSVSAPEKRTHAPNAFFSALLTATQKAQAIREIDLDDPFFRTLDVEVTTTADFAVLDLKSIVVELQYGGTVDAPRVNGSVIFTPGAVAPQHFQAFRDVDDFSYRYRVKYSFGQADRIAAPSQEVDTPWRDSLSRALVINPAEDVPMLHVYVEPGVVDWDLVEEVESRLTYDDPQNHFHADGDFMVGAATPRQEWIVRLADGGLDSYQVQNLWHLKDKSQVAGDPETTDLPQLFLPDPYRDRLAITVQPLVDAASVVRAEVDIRYQDPDNHLDVHKNVELVPPYRATPVSIPLVDPHRRKYTYQVLLIKANGGSEQQLAQTTDQENILVSEGGLYLDVNLVLLDNLTQAGAVGLEVDLRSEPPDGQEAAVQTQLFQPGGDIKVTKRLLLRADRPRQFEYKTTLFMADSDPVESDWTTYENTTLALQASRLARG